MGLVIDKTVNGRASICYWNLSARFLIKEQATEVVTKIMKEEIDIPVSITKVLLDKGEAWDIVIEDMCWAANLTTVAKILESVDYQSS